MCVTAKRNIFFWYEKWVFTAGVSIIERIVVFVGLKTLAPFTHMQRRVGQFILPLGLADPF